MMQFIWDWITAHPKLVDMLAFSGMMAGATCVFVGAMLKVDRTNLREEEH